MESLQNKIGKESPEQRKKREKALVGPNVFTITLCIAMVVIGAQYNEEQYCREGSAPLFLLLGGGIMLGTTALKILVGCTKCEWDDKLANCISPLAGIAYFCVLIWGSVVVFGALPQWEYEDEDSEHYCASIPFIFSVVMLIIYWVLIPLMICCELMACFCGGLCGSSGNIPA